MMKDVVSYKLRVVVNVDPEIEQSAVKEHRYRARKRK